MCQAHRTAIQAVMSVISLQTHLLHILVGGTRQRETPPKWLEENSQAALTADTEAEAFLPTHEEATNTM